jgi:hypothetical protein
MGLSADAAWINREPVGTLVLSQGFAWIQHAADTPPDVVDGIHEA